MNQIAEPRYYFDTNALLKYYNPLLKQFIALKLPEKAKLDAFHLATAVWYKLDYLLSWNCKHIVSGRVRKIVQEINAAQNLPTPILCTPEELMEI